MPSFLSNLFTLTTGTLVAQVVTILLIPILTRMYPPEYFGVAQIFLSISAVLVVVAALSYDYVIMLPEKDEDSMNVLVLSVVCILGTSLVSGAAIYCCGDWVGEIFNTPLIADYIVLIPVFVVFNSLFISLNGWLSRRVKYGILSQGIVMNSVSTRVFQIGGGLVAVSPLGLILGSVLGQGISNLYMFRGFKDDLALLKAVTVDRMKQLARRYWHFSVYGSTGSLANSLSAELPTFMLGYFFNPTVLGYYALAAMAVRLPMTVVGKSIAQVFFQRASLEMNQTGGVQGVVREIHTRLISLGIFPFVIFVILAKDLFTFVFGQNWLDAGMYAQILAPWFFAVFIFSPISSLFGVLERQRAYLAFEILTMATWAAVFFVGGSLGDPLLTLALFSLGGVLIWGSKSVYLIRESRTGYHDSAKSLARSLLLSVVVSLPVTIGVIANLPLAALLVLAGVTAVVYYGRIISTDTLLRNEIVVLFDGFLPARYTGWIKRS